MEICRPRVGEANPLVSVCRALWRPTALAKKNNAVGRQRNLGLDVMVLSLALLLLDFGSHALTWVIVHWLLWNFDIWLLATSKVPIILNGALVYWSRKKGQNWKGGKFVFLLKLMYNFYFLSSFFTQPTALDCLLNSLGRLMAH